MKAYKILDLIQGSDEWLEARLNFLCASEASAVMDESKFMSRNQLLDLKKGWISNPNSSFKEMLFQKGHEHEAMARPIFELEEFEDFPPVVLSFMVSIDLDHMKFLSSFDGLGEDTGVVWEHKDWNLTLSENIRNGVLEPQNYWQLEHQMLVAGVKEATITCSDGTADNWVSMVYKSVPKRRKNLILASKQFLIDLDNHELEAKVETFETEREISLPCITYNVVGTEITSNIADCLPAFKDQATFEMSRVLESDEDFVEKDKMNKAVIKARSALKEQRIKAKEQFFSFSQFDDVAEQIDKILLKMQSHGEKQVIQAKAAKKLKIKNTAKGLVVDFNESVNKEIYPIRIDSIYKYGMPDFDIAMKNKRTIESLQNAVDSLIAEFKVDVNEIKNLVLVNLKSLRELASEYEFLFMDTTDLVKKDNESLIAIIKNRISEHKEAEQIKLDLQREEIRKEEELKANKKAEAEKQAIRLKKAKLAKKPAKQKTVEQKRSFHNLSENGQGFVDFIDKSIVQDDDFKPVPNKPTGERLAEIFKDSPLTVKQFLTEYNEREGYGTDKSCLIETLTEATRVYDDPNMDEHRWYICQEVVNEIDGTFIRFTAYIITGDNNMSDMGLEYDLDSAEIVQRKERTVIEIYYE